MSEYNKPFLLEYLVNSVIEVTFTKADGSSRKMICTLREDMLPPKKENEKLPPETSKEPHPTLINVWDVEAKGWRSFHSNRVTDVKPSLTVGG